MTTGRHKITWVDAMLEPRQKPDPRYPKGIDLDMSGDAAASCKVDLPYPAKRIGHYRIECLTCRKHVAVTTAGRADDPRSATIACKIVYQ